MRLTAPRPITDEILNQVLAHAMKQLQEEYPAGRPVPAFEEFLWNLYASANRLFQVTWDVEVIGPAAVSDVTQAVDGLGAGREITVRTVSADDITKEGTPICRSSSAPCP